MNTYTLVDYYDVWKNEEGFYTVNDVMKYNKYISIPENASDTEIIQALINKHYLTGKVNDYRIEASDDMFIEIFQNVNDMPLCALEKEA